MNDENANYSACIVQRLSNVIGYGVCFEIIPSSQECQDQEIFSSLLQGVNIFLDYLDTNRCCIFGFFHIKAIDEASHDRDYNRKVKLIEDIDRIIEHVVDRLSTEYFSDEFHIVITGDHTTLCRIGEHSCEPVPFLISGPISRGILANQSQISAQKLSKCFIDNNLGRFSGQKIIEFLKHKLNT